MMNKNSQDKWNRRWLEKAVRADWRADPWLCRALTFLTKGKSLDLACGIGRHAIFLAEKGFAVTALDFSEEALSQLTAEAHRRQLVIDARQVDLERGTALPKGPFDLILSFFYLHRPLLPQLRERLKPGGIVVLRTFSAAGADKFGPVSPEISLRPGELIEVFSEWEILLHEEGVEPSKKGGSVAGIVARRP